MMIDRLSTIELSQRANWPSVPSGADQPLAALVADYLRASLKSACQEEYAPSAATADEVEDPVSAHTILQMTEYRLGTVFAFQSSLQSRIFGDDGADDSSREFLRTVLEWLVNIGDVISVGHGWYYPAPTRIVELPSKDFAILSGSSTEELERGFGVPVRSGAVGRLVHVAPRAAVIRESYRDWLKVPPSLSVWTRQMLAVPLPPLVADAAKWKVAHFTPDTRFEAPTDTDIGPIVVARVEREATSGYTRYLARLRRDRNTIGTEAARTLNFHDCTRLLNGMRLDRGLPLDRVHSRPCDADHSRVTTSKFQLPEIVTLLTFFAVHRTMTQDGNHVFTVPKRHEPRLETIFRDLGINFLTSHG